MQGTGGLYKALIDVPSRVFDVDFVRALRELGATSSLRYIIITRLTPERLPVLARVLAACEQQGLQVGEALGADLCGALAALRFATMNLAC